LIRFNLLIRHGKKLIIITNGKIEQQWQFAIISVWTWSLLFGLDSPSCDDVRWHVEEGLYDFSLADQNQQHH
jgi:hypothetical protein